jgi:ArsR family transcriptional regulator
MKAKHLQNAKVLKAFSDETRLRILELLQSGEKCDDALVEKVNVGHPTLSHHIKILVDSGIVSARKVGRRTYYSISEAGGENAVNLMRQLTTVTAGEADYELNCYCYGCGGAQADR